MGARPLLLLAVLLGGLFALKGLNLVEDAVNVLSERAYAAETAGQEPPAEETEAEGEPADDGEMAPPPPLPDAREAARRDLPTASRLGLERNLAVRRRELDQREDALDTREQLLIVAERRVDERIAQLETLRDEVQALLGQLESQEQEQIAAIVRTYAQLEPDAAAQIMVQMNQSDPDTLLLVAEQLNSDEFRRRFAAIMAELPPQIAASLTSQLRAQAETAEARLQAEARFADAEG
jgi:flagellar motility protein MotE (MotC chaperone)